MPWRDLIKLLLSLALLLGFPGVPTLLVQSSTGPAPVEEREERVAERAAEKVVERSARDEGTPSANLEVGVAPRLLTLDPPRAPQPARDATRLAVGISTTRLRC